MGRCSNENKSLPTWAASPPSSARRVHGQLTVSNQAVLFDGDRCHPDDDARRQVPCQQLTPPTSKQLKLQSTPSNFTMKILTCYDAVDHICNNSLQTQTARSEHAFQRDASPHFFHDHQLHYLFPSVTLHCKTNTSQMSSITLVLDPSQIANKARYHDAVKNTCYMTDL